MTQQTHRNLNVAMHAEAFASAKYKRYAAFSRSHEHAASAKLLTEMADNCRVDNFAEELKLSGMAGDNVTNLKDVLQDLQYHVERYRQFAAAANKDGDQSASRLFSSVMQKDESLVRELQKAIDESPQGDSILSVR